MLWMLYALMNVIFFGAWVWSVQYQQPACERRLAAARELADQASKDLYANGKAYLISNNEVFDAQRDLMDARSLARSLVLNIIFVPFFLILRFVMIRVSSMDWLNKVTVIYSES